MGDTDQEVPADGASPADEQRVRAYCGDAHHHECTVSGEQPPQYLDLPVPAGTSRYRLVRDPMTGLPARDPGGALVFVPARSDSAAAPAAEDQEE